MPRIPTYTASLTTPQSRTAEEISIASAQQPGAALQNLGHEIQRAGAITVDIADQRSKEIDLRYASDAGQQFTEDSIRWQQENGNREDSGEAFKTWSDKRILELEKGAPSGRAAQVFKQHVLPQANSDWKQNLARSESIRLSNFKVGEATASQSAQDAFRFRFNQGRTDAEPLRVQDLKNQIARTTAAYGTIAPAHAADLNEQAVVSAVLGAAEHSPSFARKLLDDFPLVDIPKRETLLNHIEAKEESMNTVARTNTLRAWDAQRTAAWNNLTPIVTPKSYDVFGRTSEAVKNQQEQQDKIVNEAIRTFSSIQDKNYSAQQAALLQYSGSDDASKQAVESMLASRIEQSRQRQVAAPHLWLTEQNMVVSEAQAEWQNATTAAAQAGSPEEKAALLAQARGYRSVLLGLSMHFQGAPPPGADPSYYLFRNSGEMQVLTPAEAQSYADAMMQSGAETRDQAMMEFSASVPEEHLGLAWSNLATLPPDGHKLPVSWQFASTIPDPIVRKRVLNASVYEKEVAGITPERKKMITDALEDDETWKAFGETMVGENYQRAPWVQSGYQTIVNDAIGLMLKEDKSEKAAVKQSLKDIIGAQWSFQNMPNGQKIAVAVHRSEWTLGQTQSDRTEAELNTAPVVLWNALKDRLPTTLIPNESLNWIPAADKARRGEPEVEALIKQSILQAARWKQEGDGQSYSLYLYDALNKNEFQLLDANNRPFVVSLDTAVAGQSRSMLEEFMSGGLGTYQANRLATARSGPITGGITSIPNVPILGAEWINQQPGMAPSPAIEKARIISDPKPKPPKPPVKR